MTLAENPLRTSHDWLALAQHIPHAFNRRYLLAMSYLCFIEDPDLCGAKIIPRAKEFLAHRFLDADDFGLLNYKALVDHRLFTVLLDDFRTTLLPALPEHLADLFPSTHHEKKSTPFLRSYLLALGVDEHDLTTIAPATLEHHGYVLSQFFGGWDDEPVGLLCWNMISEFQVYPDLDDSLFSQSLTTLAALLPVLKERRELESGRSDHPDDHSTSQRLKPLSL